jgi:hypothetical protein
LIFTYTLNKLIILRDLGKLFSPRFRSIKEYLFFRLILMTIILNSLRNFLFLLFNLFFRCFNNYFFLIIHSILINLNCYFLLARLNWLIFLYIKIVVINMINYEITAWGHKTLIKWFIIFSWKTAPIHFLLSYLIYINSSL